MPWLGQSTRLHYAGIGAAGLEVVLLAVRTSEVKTIIRTWWMEVGTNEETFLMHKQAHVLV